MGVLRSATDRLALVGLLAPALAAGSLWLAGCDLLGGASAGPAPAPAASSPQTGSVLPGAGASTAAVPGAILGAPSAGKLMLRAQNLLDAGQPAEALKIVQQAQAAGFLGPELHLMYGLCHQALGDRDQTRRELEQYLQERPASTGERALLAAKILRELGAPPAAAPTATAATPAVVPTRVP